MGRRSESVEDAEHVVLLDQLAHHRRGLARVVGVVLVDVVDRAAVHAALAVHVLEHRLGRRRDLAVARRGLAGERLVAPDGDLGRRHPRRRRGVGPAGAAGGRGLAAAAARRGEQGGDGQQADRHQSPSPPRRSSWCAVDVTSSDHDASPGSSRERSSPVGQVAPGVVSTRGWVPAPRSAYHRLADAQIRRSPPTTPPGRTRMTTMSTAPNNSRAMLAPFCSDIPMPVARSVAQPGR